MIWGFLPTNRPLAPTSSRHPAGCSSIYRLFPGGQAGTWGNQSASQNALSVAMLAQSCELINNTRLIKKILTSISLGKLTIKLSKRPRLWGHRISKSDLFRNNPFLRRPGSTGDMERILIFDEFPVPILPDGGNVYIGPEPDVCRE